MSVAAFDSMSMVSLPGVHHQVQAVSMPRPQVGIERLPTRRVNNEPRELMNCKSCRQRKVKCNRLRPSCESCQLFQCPCIYDAVPKKRGPKTDVLEALVKRVDGLEAKLKEERAKNKGDGSASSTSTTAVEGKHDKAGVRNKSNKVTAGNDSKSAPTASEPADATPQNESQKPMSKPTPPSSRPTSPTVELDILVDTYFSVIHGKPYYILDESGFRQRQQRGQHPSFLVNAVYSVAARYVTHPAGVQAAISLSEEYAARARKDLDTDEPSIEALQAYLLLVLAFTAAGKAKRAFMLLSNAVGMAMALELHRESDMQAPISQIERETRRRLFWSCYLLDRFMSCGSKRPSLISDETIMLRLPCWSPNPAMLPIDGDYFQSGSNMQFLQGGPRRQSPSGMLIDISRVLGITSRYLAAGGVKGDSHFPWHALSHLSKIRQELELWSTGTDDVFSNPDSLLVQPEVAILLFAKVVYHLIHCLVYRPFLPTDLTELTAAGGDQPHSWQIEATTLCFMHANSMVDLVDVGKHSCGLHWTAFTSFCLCTAGTVHVHGAYYAKAAAAGKSPELSGTIMSVAQQSPTYLNRELQQLTDFQYAWASAKAQREMLEQVYAAHGEIIKSTVPGTSTTFAGLNQQPVRMSPTFHLEDFFDRYPNRGFTFDSVNLLPSEGEQQSSLQQHVAPIQTTVPVDRPLKRRRTASNTRRVSEPTRSVISPIRTSGPAFTTILPSSTPICTLTTGTELAHGQHATTPMFSVPTTLSAPPSTAGTVHDLYHSHHPLLGGFEGLSTFQVTAEPSLQHSAQQSHLRPSTSSSTMCLAPGLPQLGLSTSVPPLTSPMTPATLASGTGVASVSPSAPFDPFFSSPIVGNLSAIAQSTAATTTNTASAAPMWSSSTIGRTSPGGGGTEHGGSSAMGEKDPFLSMLEQIAENDAAEPWGRWGD